MNIDEAKQKMASDRKKIDDMEKRSVKNLKLAKSSLFLIGVVSLWGRILLVTAVITVYVWMYNVFVNQSLFVVLGFWCLGIGWMPAGAGYVGWTFLNARVKQQRAELLKSQVQAEATHKKAMELRKNADTIIQKLDAKK